MEEVFDKLEYAVRCALRAANDDYPKAFGVAEEKYSSMVKRTPYPEELRELHLLVRDFDTRQSEYRGIPSVVGLR
jgi:hypothetical protein